MGNYIGFRPFDAATTTTTTGKVILSDGSVHEFVEPITVAELMLEYPQQVVVEFHSTFLMADHDYHKMMMKPTPLPADKKLDVKKVYMMIPMKRGRPACSTVSFSPEAARRVLSSSNAVLRSKSLLSSLKFLPLFARVCVCPAGTTTGENNAGGHERCVVMQKKEEIKAPVMEVSEFLEESLEGRAEFYLSRQPSGRGWKPSLDTIKEKKLKKKIPYWLF